MRPPRITIKTNGITSTEVFLDGKKLEGVRKISFSKTAGVAPILQLDLLATDLEIDAVMVPALPEVLRPFYKEREPSEDDSW